MNDLNQSILLFQRNPQSNDDKPDFWNSFTESNSFYAVAMPK